MKKRFAVIFSVLMALFTVITTAFSLGVSAEGEKTVELTGAYYVSQKTGDIGTKKQNAPVFTIELRFSAPVTIPAAENIWLRISAESGTNQIKPKNGEASVEYLNPETVNGAKYSDRIRLTFDGWTAADSVIDADFYKNNYKLVFTEYLENAYGDGLVDARVAHGKNGETIKATSTNNGGASFTVADITALPDEKPEDKETIDLVGAYYISQKTGDIGSKKQNAPVFTIELRFSAPVTVPAAENIWLRLTAENGTNQIKPQNGEASVEYLNPETVNGAKYSDRIRLTFDGWTAADSVINADFFKNNYKVVITEYSGSAEDEIIDATVVHGKNGETVKATSRNGQGFSFAVCEILDGSPKTGNAYIAVLAAGIAFLGTGIAAAGKKKR
ncbi:MAG: hypothetical protein MR241_01860 [Firmicutes bacterium]|uniref:Uncharacterized protein n=1 Tax=Candidatus Colimorpha enterica TaxID=3083063 RepID=A0AAE3FET3_9BACT|nr:hypothetical protein [Candidatus Colimorpha enterica]